MRQRRAAAAVAVLMALIGGLVLPVSPARAAATAPLVRTFSIASDTGAATQDTQFTAFPADVSFGANVAAGNLDADAAEEIVVGTTPGSSGPRVEYRQQDGGPPIASFFAYGASFRGGVNVAAGNIDDDAADEVVTGAGPSAGPHVKSFDTNGGPGNANFFAYEAEFRGGVQVAVGDVDGDGADEIVTSPGRGRAATIKVFSVSGVPEASFDAFDPQFLGGASVAVADIGGDANEEIVVGAGPDGGSQVKVFDGAGSQKATFLSHGTGYDDGVLVAAGMVNATPRIIVAALTESEPVRVFDPAGTKVAGFDPSSADVRQYSVAVASGKVVVADAEPPLPVWELTTAAGPGGGPHIRNRTVPNGSLNAGFFAFDAGFTGGVNIARGDVNGDLVDEFVAGAGPGGQPAVRIFDASGQLLGSFLAYDAGFKGGVDVAVGDFDGDGVGEIVTGAGRGGGPHVRFFDETGRSLGPGFFAYGSGFAGGVRVAAADLDGDGADEIVTGPGAGGGPHVKLFVPEGGEVGGFFAYGSTFGGGVDVGAGDFDGDGADDIVTGPGPGGGPHVKLFSADAAPLGGFFAYGATFDGGVHVTAGDVDNDGVDEVATGPGPGGGPHVRLWRPGGSEVVGYFAYAADFSGGVDVALGAR